jgi:hypothetical protein
VSELNAFDTCSHVTNTHETRVPRAAQFTCLRRCNRPRSRFRSRTRGGARPEHGTHGQRPPSPPPPPHPLSSQRGRSQIVVIGGLAGPAVGHHDVIAATATATASASVGCSASGHLCLCGRGGRWGQRGGRASRQATIDERAATCACVRGDGLGRWEVAQTRMHPRHPAAARSPRCRTTTTRTRVARSSSSRRSEAGIVPSARSMHARLCAAAAVTAASLPPLPPTWAPQHAPPRCWAAGRPPGCRALS